MKEIDKDTLLEIIKSSSSKCEVIEKLGKNPYSGGGFRTLKKYIDLHEIDIDIHLVRRVATRYDRYPDERVFSLEKINPNTVRKRLISNRRESNSYWCDICGNTGVHHELPLTLQIDHIDGNTKNNLIDNLRLLCPNCHSQTSTYAGGNRPKQAIKIKRVKENSETVQTYKPIVCVIPRDEYLQYKRTEWLETQVENISKIRNAGIDFTSYGWISEVAGVLGIKRQKVRHWMERATPDLLQYAFKKKGWA